MTKGGKSSFAYIKDGDYSMSFGTPEYVAYAISHISCQKAKNDHCLDDAWAKSIELADRFINGEYDDPNRGLLECLQDFLEDNGEM